MARPLSILYVTSELYPFAKIGGIADISYSLPLAIRDLGHDIRVMLPKYQNVSDRKNRIHEINRLKDMPITVGNITELATVKSSSIANPRTKVQAYITTNSYFYELKKPLNNKLKTGIIYPEDDERYIFFNRTVIETCLLLGWFPDIIHCNNWQAGLIPAYARVAFPNKFRKTKIVYTIQNFDNQGIFDKSTFEKTGLPEEVAEHYMQNGKFNFLRGGIYYSDYINTISPKYADEILHLNTNGNSLSSLLAKRSDKFKGISNGIDTWGWNPRLDPDIQTKFTSSFNTYKSSNKQALLSKFDLEYSESTPVVGILSRLNIEQGIKLFIDSGDKIFKEDVKVVMLGDGDIEFKSDLKQLMKKYPSKFSFKLEFDDQLAHLAEAGTDMFLLPSVYEPSGLSALYSLAYGSIPVVRATGSLHDFIAEYDSNTKTGNGFVFTSLTIEDLSNTLNKALNLYKDKEQWEALALHGMKGDYSWEKSVKLYDEIYRSLMRD